MSRTQDQELIDQSRKDRAATDAAVRESLAGKEIVVTYQGQNGTSRQVYLNSAIAIRAMIDQTAAGWVAQTVSERNRETGHYNRADYPELY
ncbi:MAG: hypothetical protein WC911_01630 [Thermoleophilia bacterium]